MTGLVCLQGGAEFSHGCEEMDFAVLDGTRPGPASGPTGRVSRVLVAPFAGRPGFERETAAANARRWYAALGATEIAEVHDEGEPFAAALAKADLLVLPGGSPARLLGALRPHHDLLKALVADGLAVSGASAGAMVLCRWTVLPEARPHAVAALGIADVDLVLPHYRGSTSWLTGARQVLPADAVVLGLPERSGVLLTTDGRREGAGVEPYVEIALDTV